MAVAIINRSATDLDSCEDFDNGRGGGGGRGGRGDRREVYSRLGRDDVDVRCGLYVAAFAVAIIAIFMFLITMVMQVLIRRGRGRKDVVVKGEFNLFSFFLSLLARKKRVNEDAC